MVPLISIIIPSFNTEKYLSDAIDSILCQTYPNWECIIIDDWSNDTSPLIAKNYSEKFPDNIKILMNEGKGACAARNHGVANCLGKYIKFLDADDALSDKDVLLSQKDFIEMGNFDLVYGNEEYYYQKFNCKTFLRQRGAQILESKPESFYQNFPITSNFLVKKQRIANLKWHESLYSGQEFFYLFQLFNRKTSFGYQDRCTSAIRIHNSRYRISNKPKNESINDTVVLAKSMRSDIDSLGIKDCDTLIQFNKQILKTSYQAIRSKSYRAAKEIQTAIIDDKEIKQKTPKARIVFTLNSVSILLGYIVYRIFTFKGKNL